MLVTNIQGHCLDYLGSLHNIPIYVYNQPQLSLPTLSVNLSFDFNVFTTSTFIYTSYIMPFYIPTFTYTTDTFDIHIQGYGLHFNKTYMKICKSVDTFYTYQPHSTSTNVTNSHVLTTPPPSSTSSFHPHNNTTNNYQTNYQGPPSPSAAQVPHTNCTTMPFLLYFNF